MRFRPSPAIAGLVAATSAITACGTEEMFEVRLRSNERMIDSEAVMRLDADDEGVETVTVVGDLDGDGLDDAIVRSFHASHSELPDRYIDFGGSGTLITNEDEIHTGAYLVYGSPTRITGVTPIAEAGVFLRDGTPCNVIHDVTGVGDLDGDGRTDFAISKSLFDVPDDAGAVLVFYGRAERLSGTVELSTADAVIRTVAPGTAVGRIARAGDVDGDGRGDFLLGSQGLPMRDIYLIRGATARLAGTVALADIAPSPLVAVEPCVDSFAAALDDLDGDGFDDFSLKSCPDIRNLFLTVRIHNLFYGRSNGFSAQARPDATLATSTIGPSQIASGDVDGDGVRELVIGETGLHEGNGGVHVIATDGARLSGAVELGAAATTYVGRSVRPADCGHAMRDCALHPADGDHGAPGATAAAQPALEGVARCGW